MGQPMATILRKLPFFREATAVRAHGITASIKPHQIILWTSLTESGRNQLGPGAARFPAILDTGHSHNFSIQEQHLIEWAGLHPNMLTALRRVRATGS